MALDSYANLLTAIANELHRNDLTSHIPDFVSLADSRINSMLRVRQMETTSASTTAAGVLAVPSNYIGMKHAYVSSSSPVVPLNRRDSKTLLDMYPDRSTTGTPKVMAREGSSFIFGPVAPAGTVVTLNYYNRFAALSAGLNSVFTAYPGLWFYAALSESAPWLKDDKRLPVWEGKFGQILEAVQRESDSEEHSGAVQMVVAG